MRYITAKNFKRYGWVIEYPQNKSRPRDKNQFRIILTEPCQSGWRIAYLLIRDKAIAQLEQHRNTFESFEPVKGRTLLYVSCRRNPQDIECFYLNKPVILKKSVWHGMLALGRESEIKITENAKVRCIYWRLTGKIDTKKHSVTCHKTRV